MNGGVYRLKQHIADIGGNVVKCKQCPRELVNEMKEYMAGRQQQKDICIQQQQELHEELAGRGKSKSVMKERAIVVDESNDTDYEDLSPNEREWREGLRQSRRAAMLESEMRRYHSTREGSSSGASVTRPPLAVKRGGSMRGTGPTGVIDTFMHRKPSSKQPSIKHALKGVKATAASAKHALIEPLVQVLRMVDGEDKNDMGYLYEAMDKAKERLREKHPTAFQKWWRIIDARWESTLHHDLHAAGYFFNLRHQYSDSPHNDGEVLQGTINVISRLSRSTEERINAMMEVQPT
ncbi:hypothetical protein Taro_002944 [Colocasia esculenta]|uniref:Uncharacterized protein n=1 Tax=Colocasia esculenta TaxID=4460 RepID=A0A843TIG8_COLES|nr:hypothetical protein [Colocasia esculenta]